MFQLVRSSTDAAAALSNQHQWPVQIAATNTSDASAAKIFVMQKASADEFGVSEFSCVASAVQMFDLPVDTPSTEGPFFRVDTITVLCRSAAAAEEFVDKIYDAVQDLADNITAATTLAVSETTTIVPSV